MPLGISHKYLQRFIKKITSDISKGIIQNFLQGSFRKFSVFLFDFLGLPFEISTDTPSVFSGFFQERFFSKNSINSFKKIIHVFKLEFFQGYLLMCLFTNISLNSFTNFTKDFFRSLQKIQRYYTKQLFEDFLEQSSSKFLEKSMQIL